MTKAGLSDIEGGAMAEVQRSLGRIEGLQEQLLKEFTNHKADDKLLFDAFALAMRAQDAKIAELKTQQDTAKTAGKVILSMLGAMAAFVGSAVLAAWSGWVSVKLGGK